MMNFRVGKSTESLNVSTPWITKYLRFVHRAYLCVLLLIVKIIAVSFF